MAGTATLPAGFAASAWPDLDPAGRALFLEEFLVANPQLEVIGSVDYESAAEPVLVNRRSGDVVSLAGQTISSRSSGLTVPIVEGSILSSNAWPWLAIAAIAGLVLAQK